MTTHALDEFAAEDLNADGAANAHSSDDVLCFECEAQPEPELLVTGPLLDLTPAEISSAGISAPLSRVDVVTLRHRHRRGFGVRRFATPAVRHTIKNYAHRGLVACARALTAFALLTRSRGAAAAKSMFSRPSTDNALEAQEFSGFVVAVALAAVVVGYGGLLAASWRTPAEARVTRVTAPRQAPEVRVVTALAVPVTVDRAAVQASVVNRPAAVRPVATTLERRPVFTPTARTLNTLWQRRDTRSLDRAFAALRSETLAFRGCAMRMTGVDRAVARCEGITIDFKRTSGRWLIARVTRR